MPNEARIRCPWTACVNNTNGECCALTKVVKTRSGDMHVLDTENCPFYKSRTQTKRYAGSKNKMFYFCDRKMCGDRCTNECVYTPNINHAVDPDGYYFGRDPVNGNFYQMPNVQFERLTIDEVRNILDNGEVQKA